MAASRTVNTFTDYTAAQQDIERRRRMAEMLQQQGMQPIEQQTAGGYVVPTSWTQGLAKMLQSGLGGYQQGQLRQEGKDLAGRRNQALADAIKGMPQEQSVTAPGPDDGSGIPSPNQTTITQPDWQQNAAWMGNLAQIGPDATQIGTSILGMRQKEQENAATREARTMDRIMTLEAAAQNRQATLEARADAQRQAEQLRRDLAADADRRSRELAADADKRMREMAAQAAADRRAMAAEGRADRAANRPVQPLVQIMGPNGQPTWVERADAVGKVPAGAGSKAEAAIAGKADVDKDVVKLKSMLDSLKEGGGIVDTSRGALSNVGAAIGSSGIGQTLGGAVGTKNQSARNELLMIRPSLLRSIMQSTGMSAKQMDSNAELKLWLSTATDPTKDYQANIEALNNIAEKYGSGAIIDRGAQLRSPRGASSSFAPPAAGGVDALLNKYK